MRVVETSADDGSTIVAMWNVLRLVHLSSTTV